MVTWTGRDGSGNGNGIKAQVFNASGAKVGGEFTVNTQVLGDQDHRAIASLPNGFVVTWDDPNGDGTGNTGVKAQIFNIDAQGNAVAAGGEILVNTATAGTQKTPSVTALSDGRFVVAWEDNNVADIKARIFNANGQPATGELPINSTTTGAQGAPTITALGTGFVAVWVDFSGLGGDFSGPSIKARIFDASGVGQGNDFLVNTITQGTQIQPVVTMLGNGDFVVAWTDNSDLLGDVDAGAIKAQVFDPTGKKIGGEFLVNTTTAKNQQDPAIAALGNHSFAVTWTDNNGGVQGQVFTLLNTAQDTALPLSIVARTTDTDGSEQLTRVVVSGIPAGTKLTDGTNTFIASANSATVDITAWNFSNITVTPPSGFSGDLQLVVTATTTDTATLSDGLHTVTGQAVQTVDITVTPTNIILGTAGADTLIGSVGSNNVYLVNNAGDVVVANEGFDTVQSTLNSYTLGANVEDLTFVGTGNFTGIGNELDNVIRGGAGDDILVGGGGADTLIGGDGNDFYDVNSPYARVVEDAGNGVDTVRTSLNTYTLDANVENLTFDGTGNFTGNGNSLDNIISGGAGADTLSGGAGNDVYFVGAGDVVNEQSGGGIDTIRTTLDTYTLGANVENLTFVGTGNFTGTGNALDNVISGGIGNDTLDGGAGDDILVGGAGADTLRGGVGNDVYVVDDAADVVVELANEGTDSVKSALNSYTLGSNLENLFFVGTGDFTGTGNELDNLIFGGAGNDTLSGGAGNDALIGGAGSDTFVFGAGFGNDQIVDFSSGQDKIQIDGLFANAAAALAAAVQVNGDVLITVDASNSLLLKNVSLADLQASDFVIPPSGNEAPTDATLTGGSVAENSANGAVVGTVTGTDPDAGDVLSYALLDTAGGRFAINASSGVITVANGSLLDFESNTSHNVTVRVTDHDGLFIDRTFTIGVTDVNEAPTDVKLLSSDGLVEIADPDGHEKTGLGVQENSPAGTFVGLARGIDPDAGDALTYSLVDNAGGRFTIDAHTGVITVATDLIGTHASLDFELSQTHNITVQATDAGGLVFTKTFRINVIDVNERPTDELLSNNTVAADASNGAVIGTVRTIDPDASEFFTYSLVDSAGNPVTGGPFAIDPGTGDLSVANSRQLTTSPMSVTVRVTDKGLLTFDKTFAIRVSVKAVADHFSIDEDNSLVLPAATLTANDLDPSHHSTVFAVGNASNGTVSLVNGVVTFTPNPNFSGVAHFDYTINDGQGGTSTATETIDVAPVADAPTLAVHAITGGGRGPELALFSSLPRFEQGGFAASSALPNGGFATAWLNFNTGQINAEIFDASGNLVRTRQTRQQ